MNITYIVYALIDPRDDSVKYIGITYDPARRLKEHLVGDSNIPKRIWINELHQLGLTPIMQLLEKDLSLPMALEREKLLIQHYLDAGNNLVNLCHVPASQSRKYTVRDLKLPAKKKVTVKLDDLITEAGLRKTELAKEVGIDPATLVRICHGRSTTRATLSKILIALEKHLGRRISLDIIEGIKIVD